jgi:alkaline phosphatase D
MMVLSGDIHRNRLDGHFAGAFALHEATASGAAVRDAVVIGAQRRNYGLLDIDAASLTVRLFHDGQEEGQRSYDRQSWLPL